MIKKFDSFLNEDFNPDVYKMDVECTGNAYRKHWIDEILKIKDKPLEELNEMDTQSLGNYYNYLYWGDDGFLDRPGMEKYKEKLKNNNN